MSGGCKATFLSKQVRRMLVEIGEPYIKNSCGNFVFIDPCLTFKWEKIETVLHVTENFSIHNQETAWFTDKIDQVWPILIEAHSLLKHSSPNLVNIYDLYEWTSHPQEVFKYLNLFLSDDVSTTEAMLFLTAVLERSLGNLFLIKGKVIPSLLRDLLSTPEMEIVLGKVPVVFLQILMGTPLALNLRNIAWHGFLSQDELYPHFVSILFVVILSIGKLLKQRKMDFFLLPKRPQIQYSVNVLNDKFPRIHKYHKEIAELLSQSEFIPLGHYHQWKLALEHHEFGRHGRSLLLLLPQLEHMLRCLFCCVNNCSDRTLTAESVTLYTTLNEIMSQNVITEGVLKENELISFLGESVIEMLQDLFVHQAGPRIRDKMSHGECNIFDIPEGIVHNLICVALVIEVKSSERSHYSATKREKETATELKNQIISTYQLYESKFHPSSLLKTSICDCLDSLNNISSSYNKTDLQNEMEISKIDEEKTELCSIIKQVYSLQTLNYLLCNNDLRSYVIDLKVQTLFRDKLENELVHILRQIVDNVQKISEQVVENLKEKYHFYSQHLLRSRQRDTFQRMVHLIPKLNKVLFCVICIVIICLKLVNNVCNLSTKEFGNLMKLCRAVLQFVQNTASLTRQDRNRWMEIEVLAVKFIQQIYECMNASIFFKDK